MRKPTLAEVLSKGDMRTVAGVDEAISLIIQAPELLSELFGLITSGHFGTQMRASDVLQKLTLLRKDWVQPFARQLLKLSEDATQKEVQWHCAQTIPLLELTPAQADRAWLTFRRYLTSSNSAIVKADALEAIALLAAKYRLREQETLQEVTAAVASGSSGVKARGRKALAILGNLRP